MSKLTKTITLNITPGNITERLQTSLQAAEQQGRGAPMQLLRQWLLGGFLLSELGHGILESLLAMDRDGQLEALSQADKALFLNRLLERMTWREASSTAASVDEIQKEEPTIKTYIT